MNFNPNINATPTERDNWLIEACGSEIMNEPQEERINIYKFACTTAYLAKNEINLQFLQPGMTEKIDPVPVVEIKSQPVPTDGIFSKISKLFR